jgi:hypothetical protein
LFPHAKADLDSPNVLALNAPVLVVGAITDKANLSFYDVVETVITL